MIRHGKKLNTGEQVGIRILPDDAVVSASQGKSCLQALLDARIDIDHSCGGMGSCGNEERLCCQSLPVPGLVLKKPN